jgi:SAM-dependent methyltransferase
MYDRESASWERRRDEPAHQELVKRTADELCALVAPPGPVADLGCGPGAHARALARRGYAVTGLDGSPRMVEVARDRACRDGLDVAYEVADVGARLPFADGSLGAVLAILVIQHLPDPASFVAEVRRCLRPGGRLLLTAPDRQVAPLTTGSLYWRLRAITATRVPGMIRFHDRDSLRGLVEAQGFTVEECDDLGGNLLVARA